jgi:prolyl-tRNA synthetase
MEQSQLFTKTRREAPKDEESINAQLLIRAGYIDKLMAGVYTFLPLGLKVLNKIENIIRKEMDNLGGQEILMPALTPKESWVATNRWDNFDALFKLEGVDKKEYALGATHEEIVTPVLKKHIFSYKELPASVYQIQTKFRNELRAKAGLIRGREFLMKDLYSFHTNQIDLDIFYKKATKSYQNIFKDLGLGKITYLTFASGGAFSKYSHEFQTLALNGEDIIHICENCKVAVNKEIIKEQSICPECGNKNLIEKKAIEVGNIFKLGNKFSNAFGFQFSDESGNKKDVIMGCYGIGPSRIMGTLAEIFHDEKGIIWPEAVAPFKIHLLAIGSADKTKNSKIIKLTDKVYNNLQKKNIEVLYDDRKDMRAGEKFADSDLIGLPYRAVISEKTNGKIELKKRGDNKIKLVSETQLFKLLS